ncbi:MAG: OpgC domain-containing protein [Rhizobiaceae bacterium]|nr:OpgC domain-containing protein [Rhizobiaceae bacterium]
MFIIFMAHMPGNFFTLYIPARFGWSDATEIFVFCSGMASAIAFGKIFETTGWLVGTMRILHRMWQVYWAHIGVFFVILALVILQTWASGTGVLCFYDGSRLCGSPETGPAWDYVGRLNIIHVFQEVGGSSPMQNFLGIMTLTWVPNLFDILPMYIVILALIPVVMALRQANDYAPFVFIILLWLIAQDWLMKSLGFSGGIDLPAEPWSDRTWFFNPFAWQLVFFTGFALMKGWLPKPPVLKPLILIAIAYVVITIPYAFWGIHNDEAFQPSVYGPTIDFSWAGITEFRDVTEHLRQKSDFGIFRYIHFLCLAYLFWILAGENGRNLEFRGSVGRRLVKVVHKVGQQSLATFMGGLVIGRFCGFVLDVINSDLGSHIFGQDTLLAWWFNWIPMTLVNLAGMAGMVAIAYLVAWLKKTPWKPKTATTAEPVRATAI